MPKFLMYIWSIKPKVEWMNQKQLAKQKLGTYSNF